MASRYSNRFESLHTDRARVESSLDILRDTLRRAEDALLRESVTLIPSQNSFYDELLEYDDFRNSRYTADEDEEMFRRLCPPIERETRMGRYVNTNRPTGISTLTTEIPAIFQELEPKRMAKSQVLLPPNVEEVLPKTPSIIPDQEASPEAKMRKRLLDSLWSQPVGLIQDRLSKSRVNGSGEWIFMCPAFEKWSKATTESPEGVKRGGNCLWLQGGLGSGKTFLMLKSDAAKEPGQENVVIYYYFDRSSGCKPYQAVSSLLRQICDQKNVPLPRFLAERETDGINVANETSSDCQPIELNREMRLADLASDFLSVQSWFKRAYICLDGLEECEDLLDLLMILRQISAVQEIRLVMTARPRIVRQCIKLGIGRKEAVIQLEDYNSSDIRKYLEAVIEDQQHTFLSDMIGKEARSGLLEKLVEKSSRNFLSAVTQATQLNRLTLFAEITDQVEKPPLQLSEVVELILSRLNDQSPQRARLAQRIFYWLSVSRRPLTLRELQQAVAAESGAKIEDPNRLPPPTLITTICMGFVHVDVEKNKVFTMPSALPFYLYQFSDEFARKAREYAAISCLALLQSETLSRGPFISQSQYDDMQQKLPFANYVSQNWGVHLNEISDEETMNWILDNESLLETLSQLLHVGSQQSISPPAYHDYPKIFGSRHFGAYFGLTVAFKKWPKQENWVVEKDSRGRSPFHVCFRSPGLYERHVMFDLFEGDTFSNMISERTSSTSDSENDDEAKPFRDEPISSLPWKWGLDYHHNIEAFGKSVTGKNLEKLFTFSKDQVTVQDEEGKTPLHYFISEWSEDILIGLFQMTFEHEDTPDHGADDESGDSDTDTDSNEDSKRSLAQRKFLPLEPDKSRRTTLDYACERSVLFGTLAFGMAKWSPEQITNDVAIAASCGYIVLVGYLCEMIEEKFHLEFQLSKAVIEASKRGFSDIVRLLSRRGTDVSVQDDNGMSPLHHAAYGRHTDTVRFLLRVGADPSQLDKAERSPLFCACESRSDTIVRLLREKGASAIQMNDEGQSLIHLAARRGNLDVAQRLLRLDWRAVQLAEPDADAAGLASQSPLHIAAREGHHLIVKLLVEEGFAIDARDGDGRTPLSYACEGGHPESVQILLAKKRWVDVNSTDNNQRTPLSYAVAEGHVDVVAAVLGQGGVDPNIKDINGKTALIHAAQRDNDTVVVLIVLASNSYAIRPAVIKSFKDLYSRFSSKPTGSIAVDVNVKDNQEHLASFYLRHSGRPGALDVAQFIDDMGERPKPKAPIDSSEAASPKDPS